MRAGNIADCVNHCEHDQTEAQRYADMRNCAAADFVNYDCASTRKDQRERSDKFCAVLLHRSEIKGSVFVYLFVIAHREQQANGRALPNFAFGFDAAAVELRNVFDDRQA